jgi:hypothetical protein
MADTEAPHREAYRLSFDIEKSLRYHQRRRRHFEWLHRLVMLGIILCGSAAFAGAADSPHWFGLAGAVLGALDLVFAFSHRARDRQELHRRFTDLAKAMRAVDAPAAEDLRRWSRERLDIESDEPPIYWAVEASCFNEVALARGHRADALVPLTLGQRLLMHWLPFEALGQPAGQPPAAPGEAPGTWEGAIE